jgi:hypothetical protein
MDRRVCTLAAGVACLMASGASAQAPGGSIGLGVGVQSTVLIDEALISLAPVFYVPIMLTDAVMLEPGIGLLRFSQDNDATESTQTFLSLGTGILFIVSHGDDGRIYVGPRVGIRRFSSETESGTVEVETDNTNLSLAGVVGGEYFLKRGFSLGGEIGVAWNEIGDDDADEDASLVNTIAEFRVRWYFHR